MNHISIPMVRTFLLVIYAFCLIVNFGNSHISGDFVIRKRGFCSYKWIIKCLTYAVSYVFEKAEHFCLSSWSTLAWEVTIRGGWWKKWIKQLEEEKFQKAKSSWWGREIGKRVLLWDHWGLDRFDESCCPLRTMSKNETWFSLSLSFFFFFFVISYILSVVFLFIRFGVLVASKFHSTVSTV